jgi:hypothetical protein
MAAAMEHAAPALEAMAQEMRARVRDALRP